MNSLHLQPYHRPNESETLQLLAQMVKKNRAIQDIDAEITQRRLKIKQDNALRQSILAAVQRIPYDILFHLFSLYVHQYQGDLWAVAHVNRTWRAAALTTPSLWTGLHIELDPLAPTVPQSRMLNGKEYCATVRQLELALSRPLNNLLHVKLASPPIIPQVVRARVPAMLHLISQRMDRWASLEVDGAMAHLPGLNTRPLDNLETLSLRTKDKSLLPLINKTAHRLQSLTTTQLGLENFENAVWWPTLRDLDITIPIDQSLGPQTEALMRVLSKAESLESLVLDFHQMQPEPNALAVLPHLRTLTLLGFSHLLPFECPNLTHLQISVSKQRPITSSAPLPTPSAPIHLKHLTHLTFQQPNLAALSSIVAPNLIELVISPQARTVVPQDDDRALSSIWSPERREKGTMLSPSVLRLEDLHVSTATIQDIRELLENLKELSVKWVGTDHVSIFKPLSESTPAERTGDQRHSAGGDRSLVCPRLSSLVSHDSSTFRPEDNLSVQSSPEETTGTMRVRKEPRYPLKSVICRWPHGNKMEEFRV